MFSRFTGRQALLRKTRSRFAKWNARPSVAADVTVLENRVLLSVTWTGAGDGSSWSDKKNWAGDVLPYAGSDVTINAAAGTNINGPTTAISIASLTLTSGNLFVDSANLTVTGATTVANGQTLGVLGNENNGSVFTANTIALNGILSFVSGAGGGILKGATVNIGAAGQLELNEGTLDGTTINGNAGLTQGNSPSVTFLDTVTWNGTLQVGSPTGGAGGVVNLGNGSTTPAEITGKATLVFGTNGYDSIENHVKGTATITSTVTINGQAGSVGNDYNVPASKLVMQGTIDASVSGGTINANSNGGTNGFELGATGLLEATNGGALALNNNWTNLGGTITTGTEGAVTLDGTFTGSTLTINGILNSYAGTFDAITVNGNVSIDTGNGPALTILDTVTLNGTVQVGSPVAGGVGGTVNLGNGSTTPAELTGKAKLVFGTNGYDDIVNHVNGTATITSTVTISGQVGSVGNDYNVPASKLVLQGTIDANVSGGTINANIFGGTNGFELGATGLLKAANGGTLLLNNNWTNLGGTTTTGTGSSITLDGTFTGSTLTVNGILNSYAGTFDAITVNGNVSIDTGNGPELTILDTVTLNGTLQVGSTATGGDAGAVYLGNQSTTPATLAGNAKVVFGASGGALQNEVKGTATIASAVTISGQNGKVGNDYNVANSMLLIDGTINSSVSGGTINANFNGGTNGFELGATGLLEATNGGTLLLNNNWTNLGGATTAGTGSAVTLIGTIAGSTLTINGSLNSDSGTLEAITVNGNVNVNQGVDPALTLLKTVTMNGTFQVNNGGSLFLGDSSTSTAATLAGTGSVVFGANGPNTVQSNVKGGTATIGSTFTVSGQNGQLTNDFSNSTLSNKGTIDSNVSGGTITFRAGPGTILNSGTLETTNSGTLTVSGLTGNVGIVTESTAGTMNFDTNVLTTVTTPAQFAPQGTVTFDGSGTAALPQLLEAASVDKGNVLGGYVNNSAFGTLDFSGPYVKLVDQAHNTTSSLPEAVYTDTVIVPSGTTLNLNHLHLYAMNLQVNGTVINGTITKTAPGKTPAIAVTDATGTYTGNSFVATAKVTGTGGVIVNGSTTFLYYAGSTAIGTGSATAPTNVGTYTVVATFASLDPNYTNATSLPVTFTIKAATPTVSVSDWGGIYTGNADAATATVTGVGGATVSGTTTLTYYSGKSATGTGSTTAPINVGTYTVVAKFTSTNANYVGASSTPLTFEIEAAAPTIGITGSPLAPVVTVTGVGGSVVSGTVAIEYYTGSTVTGAGTTTVPTKAGTYTVVIVFTSKNSNYSNATSEPVTFEIP